MSDSPYYSTYDDSPPIVLWLAATSLMVAAMIVIGGITRLTESGLSMVEWRPLIGWIPPIGEAEWARVFELYKESPEYRYTNSWMTVSDFKTIFWWEYIHRVWGRLIGIVFVLPLIVFAVRGMIPRQLVKRLVVLFILGGIQGGIGWWMVTSGLADDPEVSAYRLTVHLSMAFLILGALIWTILDFNAAPRTHHPEVRKFATLVLVLISLTIVAGAFVAGTNAGYAFNTFPLMEGRFIPEDYWEADYGWRSLFEHVPAVQFNHRWLAILTAIVTLIFTHWAARRIEGPARIALRLMTIAVTAQVLLGIATLLLIVPVWLGALHQAGAVALFATAIWARHRLS